MNPRNYCILVAEDDPMILRTISGVLSQNGYCVLTATDGREAMQREALFDGTIHVLVTNVRMPRMDGHELARTLRQKRPGIKVLIVSGEHERDFPPDARAYDFALLKPVDSEAVLSKVQQLIQERDTLRRSSSA